MVIGEKRRECGLTQAELATKLGLTQGAVSQWENGATKPSIEYIVSMSKIFGCTVDELVKTAASEDQTI